MNKQIAQSAEGSIQEILKGNSPEMRMLPPQAGMYRWLWKSGWAWIWQTVVILIFAHAAASITGS